MPSAFGEILYRAIRDRGLTVPDFAEREKTTKGRLSKVYSGYLTPPLGDELDRWIKSLRLTGPAAAAWHPSNGALVHLIATYGHRAESLLSLTWAAFRLPDDPDALGQITLPVKSGDLHRHPLLPATVAMLRAQRSDAPADALAFPGHRGRWTSRAFSTWLNHSVTRGRAGVLDLRRYAITRMLDGVGDPKTVASITAQ